MVAFGSAVRNRRKLHLQPEGKPTGSALMKPVSLAPRVRRNLWIALAVLVVFTVTGFFILTGQAWARVIGIAVAALSALSNFLFIPYYPIWALVLIALDVAVIWALATYSPKD